MLFGVNAGTDRADEKRVHEGHETHGTSTENKNTLAVREIGGQICVVTLYSKA